MSENKHICACGGTCTHEVDEVTGRPGDCVCDDCGNPLQLCMSCDQTSAAWAIEKLCETCARAYVRGDILLNLNETQLFKLANWAGARDLLP